MLSGACTPGLDLGSDLELVASSETSTVSVCESAPGAEPTCLTCAQNSCCAELQFCAAQENCLCFETCLGEGNVPGRCQAMCEDSSGMAAIVSCVAAACASECGGGP